MTITAFKIDPAWLDAKRAEYAAQVGDKPLLPLFVAQTGKVLARDRTAYLRYGPYWWAVKRVLQTQSDLDVGAYMEPNWANEYSAASDELTLLAAWSFAEDNSGDFGVQSREYDLDGTTFLLYDPDQEEPK